MRWSSRARGRCRADPGSAPVDDPVARIACSNPTSRSSASSAVTRSSRGPRSSARPLTYCTLRCFDSWPSPPVSWLTTLVLEAAKPIDVDLRLAEAHAPVRRVPGFMEQLGDVQQRLRRDASAIEADAARIEILADQHDRQTEIGGHECGGVAAGPGADDGDLSGQLRHERSALSRRATARTDVPARRTRSAGSGWRRRRR